jgi:copper chaperone CopZ
MNTFRRLVAGFVMLSCGVTQAGTVTVKGVHLCCGGCTAAATEALENVKSVEQISCDLNSKIISFDVPDKKTAQLAIESLAKGGFFGTAAYEDKPLKYPESGAKKGEKVNEATIYGLHLCCDSCVTQAQEALSKSDRISSMEFDRAKGTVRLIGQQIDLHSTIGLLNKAGYYGQLKAPHKDKRE